MKKSLPFFLMTLALLLLSSVINAQQSSTVYYSSDFSDFTASGVGSGWDNTDNQVGSATTYKWAGSTSGYSGSCAYAYTYGVNVEYIRLKTPTINISDSTKNAMVTFMLRGDSVYASNNGVLNIYVSTDGGATYLTHPIATNVASTSSWTEHTYSLSNYHGQIKLVFEAVGGLATARYLFLDTLVVQQIPTCQNPTAAYVTDLTGTSATLNWSLDTRFGQTPDLYSLCLKDANGTVVAYNAAVSGLVTSYLFSGLTPNTTYTATVRSNCDVVKFAGYSDSVAVQFTTPSVALNPPYFENFDNRSDLTTDGFYNLNAAINTNTTYSYGNSGRSVQLTTTTSSGAYIIFPLINIATNSAEVDYYIRRASSSTDSLVILAGYTTDPSDVQGTFLPVSTESLAADAAWQNKRFNTASLTDTSSPVMFCIYIQSGYAATLYLDNVSIHAIPSCTRPESLTATSYTSTDVTLDWTMANASSFRIAALNLSDSTTTYYTTSQHPYTITGLTPQTAYEFTVRGICSATDSSDVSNKLALTTACGIAASTTFIETFDNLAADRTPDCWQMGWIHQAAGYGAKSVPFTSSTSQKHNGSGRSMSLQDQPAGTISYLCSNPLNFDQSGKYTLRYWLYRVSGSAKPTEGIRLFVTPTVGDTTNAVEVIPFVSRYADVAPTGASSAWNEYEGVINYQGTGYVMVVGYSQYGAASYFDDLQVLLTPTCPKVTNVSTSNITRNSLDLTWTAGGSESQWLVSYNVTDGSTVLYDSTEIVSGTPSMTISGLQSGTQYNVTATVRAYCGGSDTAEAVTMATRGVVTLCDALNSLPYTMGFEDEETYVASTSGSTSYRHPICWTHYNNSTSTTLSYKMYPYTYATNKRTGSKCLYYACGSSTSYPTTAIFALPEVDTTAYALNNLRIKLWSRMSTATYSQTLYVGVISDLSDPATFVRTDSVVVTGASYVENVLKLSSYTGNGVYPAIAWFKSAMTSASSYMYIDDLTLEQIPSCLDLNGGITISDITSSSARITLSDTTALNSWSFAYGPAGIDVSQMTPVDTAGITLFLNNLTPATSYDIYARRKCSATNYSPWTTVQTFTTTAVPATAPYVCGFENAAENSSWMIVPGASAVNKFAIGSATAAVHNGTSALYLSKDDGTTYEYNTTSNATRTYAYLTIHFDSKGYQIEFDWKCTGGETSSTGTSIYDYGRIYLLPTSVAIPSGSTQTNITTANPDGGFPAEGIYFDPEGKTYINLTSAPLWNHVSEYVNMTNRAGDYNLVVAWNNDGSGGAQAPLAIDDISITELTCIPPASMFASVTSTSATLTYPQTGSTEWEIVVDSLPFTRQTIPAAPLFRADTTATSVTLTGLTPNTEYYMSIRTICGSGDTSTWLEPTTFHTFCASYTTPHTEGFEVAGSDECWTMVPGQSTGSISRATSQHHTGSASLMSVSASVVSPEYAVDSLTHYMINGWAYSANDSTQFSVGVMVDPNDANTYEPLSDLVIPARNTWTEFTAYFTDLADPEYASLKTAKHFVLAVTGNETIYFDDITLQLKPDCSKPSDVTISNITSTSFDISFTNSSSATQFVVKTNGTPHIITSNPATVSGLTPVTNYTVQIASVCSATDTSDYTSAGTIRTLCGALSLPWSCGFEYSEGYTHNSYYAGALEEVCWNTLNVQAGGKAVPQYYAATTLSMVHTGSQGLYTATSAQATVDRMYLILPQFSVPSNILNIKFWYKNMSVAATQGKVRLGYMTDITADSTFVALETYERYNTWTQAEFLTNGSENVPANARIVICIDRFSSAGGGICLDDIVVSQIRNCSDPNAAVLNDLTASGANVSFIDTCAAHVEWQYVVGLKGFDPNVATPAALTSKSFSVSGLTGDTEYDLYVRAICGVGDTSNYVKTSFRTLCAPFHVTSANQFLEDFSTYNYGQYLNSGTCFTILGEPSSTSYLPKVYPASEPKSTSTSMYCYGRSADRMDKCLYWSLNRTYLPDGGSILRQFHFDKDSTYEIAAWVRNSTAATYHTLVSMLVGTETTDLDTLMQQTVDGASVSSVTIEGKYWYYYNTLYVQMKTIFSPDSTGDYYVGFHAGFPAGYTSNYDYLYMDDWTIKSFTGCMPKSPTVDSVTCTTAHVTMSGSSYSFEYVLNDTTLTPTQVTTDEFTITGLTASNAYRLYVRSLCDAVKHSEWIAVDFSTPCGTVTTYPYSQTFDALPVSQVPSCWDNSSSSSSSLSLNGQYIWGVYAKDDNHMMRMNNSMVQVGTALIVSPLFQLPSQPAELQFDYSHQAACGAFDIKISTNNGASFTSLGSYSNTTGVTSTTDPGTFNHSLIDLTDYAGQNVMFQFAAGADYQQGAIFVDNFQVSLIPPCRAPLAAPVVTAVTMTTVTLTANTEHKDTLEFGIAPYSATVSPDSIVATVISPCTDGACSVSSTFTGLTGSTTYVVWYRFHCDSNELSDWSTAYVSATTMSSDCFEPQNLHTVGLVNDHHAALSWGAAPSVTSYEYELYSCTDGTCSVSQRTLVDSARTTGDTVSYDSLSANTAYYFRVRGYCQGDTTNWSTIQFTTTYPTMQMPFICDFEDAATNAAWRMNDETGVNSFTIGTGANHGGVKALYVSDDGSNYNYSLTTVSGSDAEVLLEITAGNYQVSYDWMCAGEGTTTTYDYGRFFLIPSSSTLPAISYTAYKSLPAGAISLDNSAPMKSQSSWTTYSNILNFSEDGIYKLVAIWTNDNSSGEQGPLAIDNIRFNPISCMPLAAVNEVALNSHSAKFAASRYESGSDLQYGISTYDSEDSVTWITVQTEHAPSLTNAAPSLLDTFTIYGLNTNTNYYLFVRCSCDSAHVSTATRVAFMTPSEAATMPFICSFEASEPTNASWHYASAPNYFTIGSATSTQGSRAMYVTDDGSSWNYTLTSALSSSYAYIPLAFGNGTYDIEYDWSGYGEGTYDYARVFLVPSSFRPVAGVMPSGLSATTAPSGWIAIDGGSKLNLASTWRTLSTEQAFSDSITMNLLVFWRNDASGGTQPPFAIDNIRITRQTCATMPIDSVSYITDDNSFTVSFVNQTPGASTRWIVSSNSLYTDTVATGVCPPSSCTDGACSVSTTVTGLNASTRYYVALISLCDSVSTSRALRFNVRTNCAAMTQFPYDEGFENFEPNTYNKLIDECWSTTTMSSTKYACATNTAANVHTGAQALYVNNGSASTRQQVLALPQMSNLNGKSVSFWHRAGSTTATSNTLSFGYLDTVGTFVALTDFTSKATSWQQYSATIANLPAGVTRLAFRFTGSYYYYLDDIHVNEIVSGQTYSDTICHGSGYTGHGFTFAPNQLPDGDTTFTATVPSVVSGVADSLVTLQLHVRQQISTVVHDTVCEGQPYNRGMWSIAAPETRTYFRTFTSAATGCDSTCNLILYVHPANDTIQDTICQGDIYTFGTQTLTQTGTYIDTLTTSQGCRIVTTLNLFVVDSSSVENATICQGTSYTFEDSTYTQSGTYRVTKTGAHGCPLVRTLNLTVTPTDSTFTVSFCKGGSVQVVDTLISTPGYYTITRLSTSGCDIIYHVTATEDPVREGYVSDNACQGYPYSGYGVQGLTVTQDTVILVNTRTIDGQCDSVGNVSLTFIATSYSDTSVTIRQGGSYTWHNQTYNTAGDYTDTLQSYLGCDSICTLHLSVSGTAVDNVSEVIVNIVPNPVTAGSTAYVTGDFTSDVTIVEILNSYGQVIDRFTPQTYPIEVQGINASGLCYVRLTTRDGAVHLQKLIVK